MSETKLCCNCLHCARWRRKDGIETHCDLNDRYLGYLEVMDEDNNCKHWEKETKWDLQREHDKQIRVDAIDEFKTDILNKINFEDKWLFACKSSNADTNLMFSSLRTFVNERAEQMKEKKNDN